MLRWRLLLGILFGAALAALLWLDQRTSPPGLALYPLALALSLLAAGEVVGLLASRGLRPLPWLIYGGSFLVTASNILPVFWPGSPFPGLASPCLALGLVTLAAFLGEMRRYERPGEVMERLALGVFGVVYAGLLLSFVAQMRGLGPGGAWGLPAIASLVIVVKMSDIGAYTVGRLIGRHKMAPVLSPGKTLEGAAGGVVFACAGAYLALAWLAPAMIGQPLQPAWSWLPFGVLVGLTGMFGDLAESLFKRDVGRKDSSTWLPGFGGVLDLLDSILFAAPVAYLLWMLGLPAYA